MSIFPSDREETHVEVFSQKGDPAFICGLCGGINGYMLELIEKDLNENREFLDKGDGRYLYRARFVPAQIDGEGRVEIPDYFDLDLISFLPSSEVK